MRFGAVADHRHHADRRFLSSDERGSIISVTDSSGALLAINRYDEFGQPQSTNIGRFGYTSQAWLPEVGLWYYRARMYQPEFGRFLQTDPIRYADSPNLYQYVLNDPINLTDPLGLCDFAPGDIGICGRRPGGTVDWTESLAMISGDWMPRSGDGGGKVGAGTPLPMPSTEPPIEVIGKLKPKPAANPRARPTVETPSLDLFTFWNHFRHGSGETICLTSDQFQRVTTLGNRVGKSNPNGANLVSFYGTPLENTFGSATIIMKGGKAVGFLDRYDFNMGAGRSFSGELKTIGGAILGAGAEPFETRYPC